MSGKGKNFSSNFSLKCHDKVLDLKKPCVMGILNLTPDSFFDGGRYTKRKSILDQMERMVGEGAAIIDLGAVSTRPGAVEVDESLEKERLLNVLYEIRKRFPEVILSVDTYRASVASDAIDAGADMINDISAGRFDDRMLEVAASYQVPLIMMHIQGTPTDMQLNPKYDDVFRDLSDYFTNRIKSAHNAGLTQVVIDPGFGFGKNLHHNYEILRNLGCFAVFDVPVLVGLSRKSMINRVIETKPDDALNGTTVLNTLAILNGANILRVHDVKQAMEVIGLCEQYVENPA